MLQRASVLRSRNWENDKQAQQRPEKRVEKRSNKPLEKRVDKRAPFPGLRIARTSVGKGVFAARAFVDGEVVGEITGETIVDPDYTSRYAFDLENGYQLEPEAPFRFVNHSCNPNCSFQVLEVKHDDSSQIKRQLLLFTIDEIPNGEELTIDYNWPASYAIPCRCGSEYCRGMIIGQHYLNTETPVDHPPMALAQQVHSQTVLEDVPTISKA